jgi:adenine-specific DNA-methyltransferase
LEEIKSKYTNTGFDFILPVDPKGILRVWRWAPESFKSRAYEVFAEKKKNGYIIKVKDRLVNKLGLKPKSVWYKSKYTAALGTNLLKSIIGEDGLFTYPKSVSTIEDSIRIGTNSDSFILDFFAGSGTTGHAVINLNREDEGKRKYILVEMGAYFDTVLKPRIAKVIYSEEWKDGKPVSHHTGISHMFKYIRLESYEDTLANLELKRTDAQKELLNLSDSFRESYMLKYMLDTESGVSQSLLNIDAFEDPFNYKLLVGTGSVGETKPVNVDLVETFNWLLGLHVRHMDHIRGFRVIEGMSPENEKVLIIWRNIKEKSNKDLNDFFKKQQYNTMDMEFDVIYVNGDNNLMNLPMTSAGGETEPRYKVRLIEEEFKRLMFDVKDI